MEKPKTKNKYIKDKKLINHIGGIIDMSPADIWDIIVRTIERKPMTSKMPPWFKEWSTDFDKKNDARWDKQEEFNKNIRDTLNSVITKNNLKT